MVQSIIVEAVVVLDQEQQEGILERKEKGLGKVEQMAGERRLQALLSLKTLRAIDCSTC